MPLIGRNWPTERERELIIAAAGVGAQASAAWSRWNETSDLLAIEGPAFSLLPLLWANRAAAGVGPNDLILLKGAYRRSLWQVHRTLAGGLAALETIERAGISTMVLKGAAMLAAEPTMLGVRPMDDVDILVPRNDARRAIEALQEDGWRSVNDVVRPLGVWHAVDLVRGEHERVDLHWSATSVPGDDRAIWRDAQAGTLVGRPVLIPAPAAQLLITCIHGVGPGPVPVRWVTDALRILNRGGVDWDELVAEARRRAVTVPLLEALTGLHRDFGADIPSGVLAQLRATRATVTGRLVHRVAGIEGRGSGYIVEFDRYRRLRSLNDPDRATSFLGHCARKWGFESTAGFLRAAGLHLAQLARHGRAESWDVVARSSRAVIPDRFEI